MKMRLRRMQVQATVAVAVMLVAAACGSSGKSGSHPNPSSSAQAFASTGFIGAASSAGSPVSGGTLTANADLGEPLGLDPIKDTIDGTTGMSDLAAIYDVLLRYDPVNHKYVPQLAKSITSNSGHTVWTLTLRPGIKFTDGTPLNAAAVKFNVDRFSGKDSIQYYGLILAEIDSVTTPDDLTVVFNLKSADAQFPWILTQGLGLVGSPTAIQKEGPDQFNRQPVGAGPFMVAKYTPGQELDVVRNPHYWNGPVYLNGIHFVWPQGDRSKVQALQSGDLGLVHISDPVAINSGLQAKQAGFTWLRYGGASVMMNERAGHHASDVRVRQAVAYAINPKAINERVWQGTAIASSALFPRGILHTSTPPLSYDPAKARQLLDEVKKSTGWDGSIPILVSADPIQKNTALTVQAMLNAVGFKSTIDTVPSIGDFTADVYVKFDYDLAIAALDVTESDPWAQLIQEFAGPYAPEGYKNAGMNAALDQLRAASTPDQTEAAISKVQQVWNATVPEVWFTVSKDTDMWTPKLHGVQPTSQSAVLLDKAWLGK